MAYRFPGQGQQVVGLNYLAAQPGPVVPGVPGLPHAWGRGVRLGNGMPVPPGNMGQVAWARFPPEEWAELAEHGVQPPEYLEPLQRAGIVRRAGEPLAPRNMFRRAAGVAAAAGQPIGFAGLAADYAWGPDNEDAMGPPQLRLGRPKKEVKHNHKARVREFAHNEEAAAAGNGNLNYEVNAHGNRPNRYPRRMGRKGPKSILGYPPELDPNDPRREGASGAQRYYDQYGNPSNQNVTNRTHRLPTPQQGNEHAAAANLHEELEGPRPAAAAALAPPAPAPPAPRPYGLVGRLLGAMSAVAGSSGSAQLARPSSSSSSSSSSFANRFLEGGKSRRQKKRTSKSKSLKNRTRRQR
jgi:hypothetical protein